MTEGVKMIMRDKLNYHSEKNASIYLYFIDNSIYYQSTE